MMFFSALFITKNEGETQKIYEGKKYYSKINPEEEEKSFVCLKKKMKIISKMVRKTKPKK